MVGAVATGGALHLDLSSRNPVEQVVETPAQNAPRGEGGLASARGLREARVQDVQSVLEEAEAPRVQVGAQHHRVTVEPLAQRVRLARAAAAEAVQEAAPAGARVEVSAGDAERPRRAPARDPRD